MKIEECGIGYVKHNEKGEMFIGVKEILNFKDLSFTVYVDGELKDVIFLTKEEALNKFGNISEEVRDRILSYDK